MFHRELVAGRATGNDIMPLLVAWAQMFGRYSLSLISPEGTQRSTHLPFLKLHINSNLQAGAIICVAQAAGPRLCASASLASIEMCCASFQLPALRWAPNPKRRLCKDWYGLLDVS